MPAARPLRQHRLRWASALALDVAARARQRVA